MALLPILLIAAAAVAVWLWLAGSPARRAKMRLRRICLGDEAQVEQLIQAEIRRTPGISRAEAASRAVQRYERDNR